MGAPVRVRALVALVAAIAVAGPGACSTHSDQAASAAPPLPSVVQARIEQAALPVDQWGFTAVDRAQALARAHALDLDVAAGRVIVAAIGSPDPAYASDVVLREHLAGVIVMRDALVDPAQIQALTRAVVDAAAADGQQAPPIISVDQEGGPVARLRGIVPDLPAFMAAGASDDADAVVAAYRNLGLELRDLGFTVDWAPVADVTIGAGDPTIGVRSAGDDPERVSRAVESAMTGLLGAGVLGAVKHFPGHGSVTVDSHAALPLQNASLAALRARDLIPFERSIESGTAMVMVGHIAVAEWSSLPASIEPKAYAYLREELGFDGVAVTDALNMDALGETQPGASAVAALAAGADLLLMPADPGAARQAIIAAVASGAVPRERLDEAIAGVELMMMYQERRADATAGHVAQPDFARDFTAGAIVVSGPVCEGPLVGASVDVTGGSEEERATLVAALATHGIASGGGTTVRLLGSSSGVGSADVVVALDAPWGLAQSTAGTKIGLFGRSDDALAALADVLAGARSGRGAWPVAGLGSSCGDG